MLILRLLIPCFFLAAICPAQDDSGNSSDRTWSIHFQATSIGQQHGSFSSLYDGTNSLPTVAEHRVSLTATIFLKFRVSSRWEFVVHPEVAGGRGFGLVTGIAGFTNGEIPRVSAATPTLYLARAYVRYTIPLGGEGVEGLSITAGKFAITDFFDNNTYSHDPRTQFMNWAPMSNSAWDYPADTRGYTIGSVQEFRMRNWSVRAATVMEPTEANGPASIPALDGIAGLRWSTSTGTPFDTSAVPRGCWRSTISSMPALTARRCAEPARFPTLPQRGETAPGSTASA